ncbi:MAG: hypothetical protein ACRDPD_26980 [Streptosporangiaceae bacterium]
MPITRVLPPHWLLTAGLALGRAADEEVKTGRMTIEEATGSPARERHELADRRVAWVAGLFGAKPRAGRRASVRQAACATVRSEMILPNGPWFCHHL